MSTPNSNSRSKIGPKELDVLRVMGQLPEATIEDVTALGRFPHSRVYEAVKPLRQAGLVDSAQLGWTRDKVARYWLTDEGLKLASGTASPSPWHCEFGRSRLLQRLPAVELGYPAAAQVTDLGPFETLLWVDHVSFDFAVKYRDGWIVVLWSGALQRETDIIGLVESFGEDMVRLSTGLDPAWPSRIIVLASDRFQEALFSRVIRRYGILHDRVSVWCTADGTRSGSDRSQEARGWIHQTFQPGDMGGWPWERRLQSSPWAKNGNDESYVWGREGSLLTGSILDLLAERPRIPAGVIRAALGEEDSGRAVVRRLAIMVKRGLLQRLRLGRERGQRYELSSRGRNHLVLRDRVRSSSTEGKRKRSGASNGRGKGKEGRGRRGSRQIHEDRLTSLYIQLACAGAPVATGERSWEHMGDGAIAPDIIGFLDSDLFGPTWVYFELERTAQSGERVQAKSRGYANPRRQNDWPLALIAETDAAERNFQEEGRELGIQMITTTKARLEEHGPLGNDKTWSHYGTPVQLRAPAATHPGKSDS